LIGVDERLVQEFPVLNAHGLHARSGALLVKAANRYESEILIEKDGNAVNGKSIMGVLMLAAGKGSRLIVTVEGPDAQEAMAALRELFEAGFHEEP
jgi:phosphocarrier protein HPr